MIDRYEKPLDSKINVCKFCGMKELICKVKNRSSNKSLHEQKNVKCSSHIFQLLTSRQLFWLYWATDNRNCIVTYREMESIIFINNNNNISEYTYNFPRLQECIKL